MGEGSCAFQVRVLNVHCYTHTHMYVFLFYFFFGIRFNGSHICVDAHGVERYKICYHLNLSNAVKA